MVEETSSGITTTSIVTDNEALIFNNIQLNLTSSQLLEKRMYTNELRHLSLHVISNLQFFSLSTEDKKALQIQAIYNLARTVTHASLMLNGSLILLKLVYSGLISPCIMLGIVRNNSF